MRTPGSDVELAQSFLLTEGVIGPPDDPSTVKANTLSAMPERLRTEQKVFASTGGLHAAALFDMDGATLAAEKTSAHTVGESPMRDRISKQPALSLERDFAGCCEFGVFGFTLISSFCCRRICEIGCRLRIRCDC